jgi:hypothetical protein
MFLGWYDPDRKKPARAKLAEAYCTLSRKVWPNTALLPDESTRRRGTGGAVPKVPGEPPVSIQARNYIARWTFYIGEEAGSPPRVLKSGLRRNRQAAQMRAGARGFC